MIRDGIKTQTIQGNGQTEKYDITGKIFKLYECTEAAGIEVKINEANHWEKILETHAAIPDAGMFSVQFRNLSPNPTTIMWAVWPYEISDNLIYFTSSELVEIQNQLQGKTTFIGYGILTLAANTQTQVVAANAARIGFELSTDPDNANPVFVGFDNTVTASKAFAKLNPGGSFSLNNYRGAIHVYTLVAGNKVMFGEW